MARCFGVGHDERLKDIDTLDLVERDTRAAHRLGDRPDSLQNGPLASSATDVESGPTDRFD